MKQKEREFSRLTNHQLLNIIQGSTMQANTLLPDGVDSSYEWHVECVEVAINELEYRDSIGFTSF